MGHIKEQAAEELLDKTIPVLDHGFVRLVDYMGGDDRIVQAARVSYGTGTKGVRADAALIDYLMRNKHTSPFEQVEFTFHMKLPIMCARQIVRHRTASLNELSGRYSVIDDDMYVPDKQRMRAQSKNNKQGSGDRILPRGTVDDICCAMRYTQEVAYDHYKSNVDLGLSRELSRLNLPLSTYTAWYWKIDLHNLLHFLSLRMDSHTQWETRQYANVLWYMVKVVCPVTAKAFETHVLNSATFTADEFIHLKQYLKTGKTGYEGTKQTELTDKIMRLSENKNW